jgi:hypothetical protein
MEAQMIAEAGSAPVLGKRQPGGEGIDVEMLALRHLAVHIATCPNELHAGQLERLSSDATADARTVLATTRALSALVAAVADSVERRLDAVETGCELLVRRQR